MVTLICLSFIAGGCYSQTKQKKDVYLYFKEDRAHGIHKEHRRDGNDEYSIYWYRIPKDTGRKNHIYAYSPINAEKYTYANNSIIKSVKTIFELDDISEFGYDTRDQKRFPFKRVFIVEDLGTNQHKIIQVNTYMGSDYY
jgi:hypothetical protein